MLQNKGGLWKSNDLWNFTTKDNLIYIENISKTKVLGTTNGKFVKNKKATAVECTILKYL